MNKESTLTTAHKLMFTLFVALIILIFISSTAQMDIVVSARGELKLNYDVEKVQHLEGGALEQLFVSKGDIVTKGQPIAKLAATDRSSALDSNEVEHRQAQLKLMVYRSLFDNTTPDFNNLDSDPKQVKEAEQLYQREHSVMQSKAALHKHDTNHKRALLKTMQSRLKSNQKQLTLMREQLNIKQTLHDEEMASYIEVLNMRIQVNNTEKEILGLQESLINEQHNLARLDKQYQDERLERRLAYQKEIQELQNRIALLAPKNTEFQDKVNRLTVYSPIDGIVDKIHYNYRSAVIPAGDSIFDITPLDNALHAEVKIPRKDIGFIYTGQKVSIKVDAYSFSQYGSLNGKIESISRSFYQEEQFEYYLASISLDNNALVRNNKLHELLPYMEVTADIKTGSRTMLEYAIKPVIEAFNSSFDER